MHTQKRRGRASFGRFSFTDFYSRVLTDARVFLPAQVWARLIDAFHASPEVFRASVTDELRLAESSIAEGGASLYIALRQLEALLKKNPDWHAKSQTERRELAYQKFLSSEKKCLIVNKRLRFYKQRWSRQPFAGEVLNQASLVVQEILGLYDQNVEDHVFDNARFGSGATFLHQSAACSVYDKLFTKHTVTEGAKPFLARYLARSDALYGYLSEKEILTVEGNRLSFVPKDWDVDRTIAIEPGWNVYFQLGVDSFMKSRLRRTGVDLKDQSRNFGPTREGSISGDYATIDLSSASDSISLELVSWLFPESWVRVFESLRSHSYTLDKGKTWHRYHKLSSMGNGFTFPVETLIFYSIAKALCQIFSEDPDHIRVYGDDIIIPRNLYAVMIETLSFAGFAANMTKSYAVGPFRESCGRDYLQGLNVRPVYLRKACRSVEDVYDLYNRLLLGSMVPLKETLLYLRSLVTRPHTGPWYSGNSSLDMDSVLSDPRVTWRPGESLRLDSYFIDEPSVEPVYNPDYQQLEYQVLILDKRFKPDLKALDLETRYRTFLYGIEEGRPLSTKLVKWFERRWRTPFWPSLRGLVGWQVKARAV